MKTICTRVVVGLMLMSGVCSVTTHDALAVTSEIIYQSDFSSDPGWITDQPENFWWQAEDGQLVARSMNRPAEGYSPSRYFYTETNLNPALSYELKWDMMVAGVASAGNSSGVVTFGLYGDDLNGFNPSDSPGTGQDGTFSIRLMTVDGFDTYVFTEVNPGYNYDIGTVHDQFFSVATWYTIILRYDAPSHSYHFQLFDLDTQVLLFETTIYADPDRPVNPELSNLGISMHPEGTGSTILSTDSHIDGFTYSRIDNVTLTQIHDGTPPVPPVPSAVLFLPGIQSSRLYTDGLLGTEDQLWEPTSNQDVAQLVMTEAGESVEDIYTRDVIDEALGFVEVYGSFEDYLESLKTAGTISDWKSFAYDWRYGVDDVVGQGTAYETELVYPATLVEEMAGTNNSKVTLIAHSNGGLLAKALIAKLEEEGKAHLIDKLILIATPHIGTPKAIGSILHGYDQEKLGGLIVDDETAREVINNMPGAYGLLPSTAYIEGSDSVIEFKPGTTTAPFIASYGTSIDSVQELEDFMVGTTDGRPEANTINEAGTANENMVNDALALHASMLDTWEAPAHIAVHEIVGVGLDTVRGFRYEEFNKKRCVPAGPGQSACTLEPYYEPVPQFSLSGDGTVLSLSAEFYQGNKQKVYVDLLQAKKQTANAQINHADITSLTELQDFIGGIIQNENVTVSYMSTTKPTYIEHRDLIAVHSPASLSAENSVGQRVGREGEGLTAHIVTDIPGSSYLEIGGATYLIIPSEEDYIVSIDGIGEAGSYTLTIDEILGEGDPTPVVVVEHATVTPDMSATFSKSDGEYTDVVVDYDNDGDTDEVIDVYGEPITAELFEELRSLTSSFALLKKKDRDWLISSINKVEIAGQLKGYNSKTVIRTFAQIDDRLVQYLSGGKITQTEYNTFTNIVVEIKTR